jgi:hypothetical protein
MEKEKQKEKPKKEYLEAITERGVTKDISPHLKEEFELEEARESEVTPPGLEVVRPSRAVLKRPVRAKIHVVAGPDKFPDRLEAYKRAWEEALADGVITTDEQAILDGLRKTLKISYEEHDRIKRHIEEAMARKAEVKEEAEVETEEGEEVQERLDLYRDAVRQAFEDGYISSEEACVLEGIRITLKISEKAHERILAEIAGREAAAVGKPPRPRIVK